MAAVLDSASRQNLSDRITAAPPQELVALLLEGARGFVLQAVTALKAHDQPGKTHLVNRVAAIIEQLGVMLNFEEGGPVVENLAAIYEWWLKELLEASKANDPERLQRIATQMGSMGEGWEQQGVA